MHEYLVSKQRKQEEYWLRKYGKVVQAAPPSVGKPSGNPRLPAIGTINSGINSGAPSNRTSNNGLPSAEPSGALLPPIAGVQQAHGGAAPAGMLPPHHIRQQQPRGQAPIFQAKEPVRDFFQRNAPRAGRGGGGGPAARDEYGNIIPPSRRPPEPLRRAQNQQPLPRQLPPLAAGGEHSYGSPPPAHQMQMQMQQAGEHEEQQQLAGEGSWSLAAQQQQQQQGYASSPDVGGSYGSPEQQQQQYAQQQYGSPQSGYGGSPGAAGGRLAPLQYEASAPALGGAARTSYSGSPGAGGGVSPYHQKPLRNLEMELSVIKVSGRKEWGISKGSKGVVWAKEEWEASMGLKVRAGSWQCPRRGPLHTGTTPSPSLTNSSLPLAASCHSRPPGHQGARGRAGAAAHRRRQAGRRLRRRGAGGPEPSGPAGAPVLSAGGHTAAAHPGRRGGHRGVAAQGAPWEFVWVCRPRPQDIPNIFTRTCASPASSVPHAIPRLPHPFMFPAVAPGEPRRAFRLLRRGLPGGHRARLRLPGWPALPALAPQLRQGRRRPLPGGAHARRHPH